MKIGSAGANPDRVVGAPRESAVHRSAWIGPTAVAVGGSVLCVGLLTALESDAGFWLAVAWLCWWGGLMWAVTRRPVSLAFVVMWGWLLVYLVLGATSAFIDGRAEIGVWVFRGGVAPALAMVALSIGCLWAGAATMHLFGPGRVPGRVLWSTAAPERPASVPELSAVRLDWWAFILVLVAAISLVLYVRLAGADLSSVNVLIGSATYGELGRAGAVAPIKYLETLNGMSGVALVLIAYRSVVVSRRHWGRPMVLAAAATALLIISGGRSWLFVPVFAAGLLVWKFSSGTEGEGAGQRSSAWARQPRRWLLLGGFAAFAAAALVGGVRGQIGDRRLDLASFSQKEVIGIFPPTVGLAETIPSQHDYLNGSSYIELIALPVPRALWPDKPNTVLGDVQLAIFGKNIGASVGFHGELFANFGLPGVVVGSFLFGALYERVWRTLVRAQTLCSTMLASAALAVMLQVFTRGYVAGQLAGQFGLVLGTVVVAARIRRWQRASP